MNPINYIVIHDSDSRYGNPFMIDSWHKDRGFSWKHNESNTVIHVGYHYLILNGKLFSSQQYFVEWDGLIVPCRPETAIGAHCFSNDGNPTNDRNEDSISICLIGPDKTITTEGSGFTNKQLNACSWLTNHLMKKYGVPVEKVTGHKEWNSQKSDPRFDLGAFRFLLNQT